MKAEMTLPGREVAYIVKTRERFGLWLPKARSEVAEDQVYLRLRPPRHRTREAIRDARARVADRTRSRKVSVVLQRGAGDE